MFSQVIIFLVFVAVFVVNVKGYSDCGSKVGSVVSLTVANCKNDNERCILKRNTNTSLEITFTSNTESDVVTAVVHGVLIDVPIPFNLPNPNGCVDSGVQCPIKPGNTYNYKTVLPVLSTYPRVTVDVKWELQDKDGKDIVCLLIPAKIK